MAKGKDQLAELVAPVLQDGEQLLATARVSYNGTVPPNNLGVSSGVSAVDPSEETEALDPDASLSFPTANQMALALTGARIFCWALSVTGKPKQFIGEVPLVGIARVESGDGSYGSGLRVHMKSTAIVDLEFMRHENGDEFVRQFESLIS